MTPHLEWTAPQYHHTHKTKDWYWAVGIISLTIALLAVIFNNVIFALFIIFGAFALCVHAAKPPKIINYEITNKGVIIDKILYPFTTLESFDIETESDTSKIIVKSKKFLMPYITLPLHEDDAELARTVLSAYLKEEELKEPFSQKIMEQLGF